MNGLDLFSGIGGITKALEGHVRPVAYCEIEPYARGVLLSRMADGSLPCAPIWDDVRTLTAGILPKIDIIYGGFPCQDISIAGRGAGLAGERSGLFFEIVRLAQEIKPAFIFLENVANIRSKGLDQVLVEIARLGYDCRYGILSASDVGAPHRRDRWWLLAHRNDGSRGAKQGKQQEARAALIDPSGAGDVAHSDSADRRLQSIEWAEGTEEILVGNDGPKKSLAYAVCEGLERNVQSTKQSTELRREPASWWTIEPNVGRVANGIPKRVDRLRALGNAVVPAQAREAFERLMGLK